VRFNESLPRRLSVRVGDWSMLRAVRATGYIRRPYVTLDPSFPLTTLNAPCLYTECPGGMAATSTQCLYNEDCPSDAYCLQTLQRCCPRAQTANNQLYGYETANTPPVFKTVSTAQSSLYATNSPPTLQPFRPMPRQCMHYASKLHNKRSITHCAFQP
jgi:hypothetical protein